jgi:hypothetical protein
LTAIAGNTLLELDVLSKKQAFDLLGKIIGFDRIGDERVAAFDIVELCGDLPLAIRIIGSRLAAITYMSLEVMARRLRDEHRRLDELRYGDLEVRASFNLSYQGCSADLQKAFRRLGVLEFITFPAWVLIPLLEINFTSATEVIDELEVRQLLEVAREKAGDALAFRFHDLIRLFSRERLEAEEPADSRESALLRLVDAYARITEVTAIRAGLGESLGFKIN